MTTHVHKFLFQEIEHGFEFLRVCFWHHRTICQNMEHKSETPKRCNLNLPINVSTQEIKLKFMINNLS